MYSHAELDDIMAQGDSLLSTNDISVILFWPQFENELAYPNLGVAALIWRIGSVPTLI
jgi:hypothetical protein